ncbi:MAG TPA: efflux RND transporter periplasmic adaptor subunit [Thermoanaerobaculia bacterium]
MKPKMTLVPLAVSLVLAACGGGAPKKLPPPEAPVRVAKVERQAVPLEVAAVGHVEASSIVSVKPQVGGVVLKVGFREGEDVAVGQILFQIDPRPFQAALAQAKANLERDRARLAEAERTLVRYEELIKKEYVTQEQLDGARANSAALKATVVGDEAAVEQSRLNLAYCQIESPVAGRTGSLLVYAGNVVKAGDDKPLVILNQIEPVRVSFAVPERVLADVKARSREGKLKVTVTPPGGAPHEGELTFVDNAVDSTTGTITLKATFANRDRALWPGQFAQVALNLATDAAVTVVPTDAVQTGQMGTYVFVVKEDKTVDLRPITVVRSWKSVSVIANGLEPGETVVTDGQIRLAPGTRISIKEDAAAAGPASGGAKP